MKNINKVLTICLGVTMLSFSACKKSFLERHPTDQAATEDVFKTVEGAEAAVQGINRIMYGEIDDHDQFGYPSIAIMWDLMGEDVVLSGYGANWFVSSNNYSASRNPSSTGSYMWSYFYKIALNANLILSKIDGIVGDQSRKDVVKAQALFYRAFAYYNLSICYMHTYAGSTTQRGSDLGAPLNFSGNFVDAPCIPIYTEPTQVGNPRSTVKEVYARITADLDSSIVLFNNVPGYSRDDKSEININVVEGIYARVALVMQDWTKAASMAGLAGQNASYMSTEDLYRGFTDIANSEWIWGSKINEEQTGIYASFISHYDYDLNGYAALGCQKKINSQFMTANTPLTIDSTDARKKWWWTRAEIAAMPGAPYVYYSQRKFKAKEAGSFAADFPLMRKAEMALIQAEAYAQSGQTGLAQTTLEAFVKIRDTAFTAPTTPTDLVAEIWKQRRIELWGEGFRYGDVMRSFAVPVNRNLSPLSRTGTGGNPSIYKEASIAPYSDMFLFQIPSSEIFSNPIDRNP